jgi:O-antigen ligase
MQFLKSSNLAAICLALALGSVHFAPALASIFTGLSVVIGISQIKHSFPWKSTLLILSSFLFIVLVNFKHSVFAVLDINRIVIYAPLLFVPLLFLVFKPLKINKLIVYLISLPPLWIVIASVLNYFNHYEFLSQMVLESKPLPLFSSVYHIEFSFILTSVLLFLGMFLWRNIQELRSNRDVLIIFILLFLGMHILSARTGLLSFWMSVGVWAAFEGHKYIKQHWKIALLGVFTLILLAFVTPSIKNRVLNTTEDLSAVINGGDLNHKSFGQRWEAWRASLAIIENHRAWGVGSARKEEALIQGHQMIGSQVDIENQVQPHNQWIQWVLEWGVIFLVFPVFLLIWGLRTQQSIMVYMSFMAIFVATQFESLLERQSGVLAVLFLLTVSGIQFSKNPKLSENSQ